MKLDRREIAKSVEAADRTEALLRRRACFGESKSTAAVIRAGAVVVAIATARRDLDLDVLFDFERVVIHLRIHLRPQQRRQNTTKAELEFGGEWLYDKVSARWALC